MDHDCAASLVGLPNELLLEILSHLEIITDFGQKRYRDASRHHQAENQQRFATLGALACTCQRLHRLAEPALYSTVFFYYERSRHRLPCFLRTIIAKPTLARKVTLIHSSVGLSENLQYDDDRRSWLDIHLSPKECDEFRMTARAEAERVWRSDPRYLDKWHIHLNQRPNTALLALAIALIPNLENLAILADQVPYFVSHVYLNFQNIEIPHLKRLIVASSGENYFHFDHALYPSLEYLELDGMVRVYMGQHTSGAEKQPLTTLHLQMQDSRTVRGAAIEDITGLKHMTCTYARPLANHLQQPHQALDSLLLHSFTLETLSITVESLIYRNASPTAPIGAIGGMADFPSLRRIEIPTFMLLGAPGGLFPNTNSDLVPSWQEEVANCSISHLLPVSLEFLVLIHSCHTLVESQTLHDLVRNRSRFPTLCSVQMHGKCWNLLPERSYFVAKFAELGVSFDMKAPLIRDNHAA